MENVKERLIGAVMAMDSHMATLIWEHVERQLGYGYEEDEATPEELAVFEAYRNGDPEYQPTISHEDLKKELGI